MNMKRRGLCAAAAICTLAGAWPLTASPLRDLQKAAPGVRTFSVDGHLSRLYGRAMSNGGDVYESADRFLRDYAGVFGLRAENLILKKDVDGLDIQPIMYNQKTGKYKFIALYYAQVYEGYPVHGASLTLLFRNDPGFPLVEAISGLKTIGDIKIKQTGTISPNQIGTRGFQPDDRHGVMKVIYVSPKAGEGNTPTLAYEYIVTTGKPGDPIATGINGEKRNGNYDRSRVIVDAHTGKLLYSESLIRSVDVTGNVSGWATPGLLPDSSTNPPVLLALPRVFVNIVGGNQGETDQNGNYTIANNGGGQVTVRSRMVGPSLLQGVSNNSGSNIQIDQNVTPPGPADFIHNNGKKEQDTAQVNGMLQVSTVHNFQGTINPAFPGLSRSFLANVNIAATCNAFFDGSSVNFYRSGGGCVNTAYSTIVYHEYGHKMVADGASNPSGDYHEGIADIVSQVLADDPVVGDGFFGPGSIIRSGINSRQFPCGGEVHFCGQVISGAVWDTRNELFITEPTLYLEIIQNLSINSILLHNGGIDPGITIDFLTLDDNDGDINNGTPHYNEINKGFSNHNLAAPPIRFLDFTYPDGKPSQIVPSGGTTMRVDISANVSDPQPGTGMLHVNDGSGWVDLSMNDLGNNMYDAVFPVVACPSTVQYYISAETVNGDLVSDPANAPDSVFTAFGASNVNDLLVDNFETDMGWTVENKNLQDGAWERGVPAGNGSRGDPASDYDGSGSAYLTGNRPFDSDVDGGPTFLISPRFNMSGVDGFISFAQWFTNDDNDGDRLIVDISNDDGTTWKLVERISNHFGWKVNSFTVSDFILPTSMMKVRFSASDNPNNSVTEAAIDAIQIATVDCGAPGGMFLTVDPLIAGRSSRLTAAQATVGQKVFFTYSIDGLGDTVVPQLNVTLGILNPKLVGSAKANIAGFAAITTTVPGKASGIEVWMQAAEQGRISNIVNQIVQ